MGLKRFEISFIIFCLFVAFAAGSKLYQRLTGRGFQALSAESSLAEVFPLGPSIRIRRAVTNSWDSVHQKVFTGNHDRLFTGEQGARVVFKDKTEVEVGPHSLVVFRQDANEKVSFQLAKGQAEVINSGTSSGGRNNRQVHEGESVALRTPSSEQTKDNAVPVPAPVPIGGPAATTSSIETKSEPSSGLEQVGEQEASQSIVDSKPTSALTPIAFSQLVAPDFGRGALPDSVEDSQPAEQEVVQAAVVEPEQHLEKPGRPDWPVDQLKYELRLGATPLISWNKTEGSTKYLLQISQDPDFGKVLREDYSNTQEFSWHEARPGSYFARVYGLNAKFERSEASTTLPIQMDIQAPQKLAVISSNSDSVSQQSQVLVGWEANPFASKYELQVALENEFHSPNVYRSANNVFPLNFGGADTRFVRVCALNDEGERASEFSEVLPVSAMMRRGLASDQIETIQEDPDNASSESNLWRRKRPKAAVTAGIGTNYFQLKQTRSDGADSEYKGMMAPTLMADATYFWTKDLSLTLSYHQFLGKLQARTFVGQTGADFKWETAGLEAKYLWSRQESTDYSLLLGLQQHRTPNGFLNTDNTITFEYETITNLSVGGMMEYLAAQDMVLEAFVRLQYPLMAKGPGNSAFTLQPKLIFDGSLGLNKYFGESFKMGFYWFGQYHNFSHEGQSGGATVSGTRDYLNSNLQLRFGYEFH